MSAILNVREIGISFGSNQILKSLSFDVMDTEVLGVIGPNGAGKTVMMDILSGILSPDKGEISLHGENITHLSIVERCRKGLGRTFQVPKPFINMTVLENVMVGSVYGDHKSEKEAQIRALEMLDWIGLADKQSWFAGKLSLLDRKRLEIGRALASNPKVLLLDEVAGGLTESEVSDILGIVKVVKERGMSVVWIEHVLKTMREGTDRVLCIAGGSEVSCGLPDEVMNCKEVRECYLGTEEEW